MKPAIVFAMLIFAGVAFGQTKPDTLKAPQTVTLSMDKLGQRFAELQEELKKAEEQIDQWTAVRNQTIGKMQELQRIPQDRFAPPDTLKKKSK